MSQSAQLYIKAALYLVGTIVASSALFYILPPSSSETNEFQQHMKKNQGMLHKDVVEARRNTQQLISRLQQVSGADTTKK